MTTIEPGARVRIKHDIMGGGQKTEPFVYLAKGTEGIVTEILDPESLGEDEFPLGIRIGWNEDYVALDDVEVVTAAADVAKEPVEFTITGKVTVEVTHRIMAMNRDEAAKKWAEMGSDLLTDWDEMSKPEIAPLAYFDIGEKGVDY